MESPLKTINIISLKVGSKGRDVSIQTPFADDNRGPPTEVALAKSTGMISKEKEPRWSNDFDLRKRRSWSRVAPLEVTAISLSNNCIDSGENTMLES